MHLVLCIHKDDRTLAVKLLYSVRLAVDISSQVNDVLSSTKS